MSTNELEMKVSALKEWEELLKEAKEQVESLKDEIKAEMLERNVEEMNAGCYICRWTPVLSNRFDSTTFKRNTAKCISNIPSRFQAVDFQSHKKKPLLKLAG